MQKQPTDKDIKSMSFNKQDSRSLIQILKDQEIMEELKSNKSKMIKKWTAVKEIINFFFCSSFSDSESPAASFSGAGNEEEDGVNGMGNEISAPYEVPQFPIEQIEKKLQLQRQLNAK
jgi:hypothetical protein